VAQGPLAARSCGPCVARLFVLGGCWLNGRTGALLGFGGERVMSDEVSKHPGWRARATKGNRLPVS
jgi:hypothetical protein